MDDQDFFQEYCIGRFQLQLPLRSKLVESLMLSEHLDVDFSEAESIGSLGLFHGVEGEERWKDAIEIDRKKKNADYAYKENQSEVKVVVLNQHFDAFRETGESNLSDVYVLKKFPKSDFSLSIKEGQGHGFYLDEKGNYQDQLNASLSKIIKENILIKDFSWPHNQLGLCLSNQLVFNQNRAYENEFYKVGFRLGEGSYFKFESIAYSDKWEKLVDGRKGAFNKVLSLFASKKLTVAGFKGNLAISDNRYSESAVDFRWISTDAKFGTTRFPALKIEGTIEIEDWPGLSEVGNSTDLLMTILSTIKPRENGFVGTW
ncbi:hypothetical protein [Pelagibaculum spongiae]|nr:hypothetical protein [Pelagibaculum spongiae]